MVLVLDEIMLESSVFVSPTSTIIDNYRTDCNLNQSNDSHHEHDDDLKDKNENKNVNPTQVNLSIKSTTVKVNRYFCDLNQLDFKRRKINQSSKHYHHRSHHHSLDHWSSFLRYFLFISILINFSNCDETASIYTDQFVAHIDGSPETARSIAEKHGFTYLDHIIDNAYHLQHKRLFKRSLDNGQEGGVHVTSKLKAISSEPLVTSFSQLKLNSRTKRDLIRLHSYERPLGRSGSRLNFFDDPKWTQMWYLNRGQGLDMNVQKVWAMNITGRGVVVTILDDGLENDHPDLIANYDPAASYDVNNSDNDPTPRYDIIDSNRHGTRCAGEVAAMANNSNCAVGVAFNARVGGLRMLDGDVTDAVEARSLSFNRDHIDIYSASWGPDDDGQTVDGPGELATKAFIDGVRKGRRGLGSIFIWASGNGGREHDNCNCDGYTNSIWTLSISSATENGLVPWYSEACSSTLATTYSSGSNGERQIVTTDLHHGCTTTHTGTSASAPLAAGISALALEANPQLTWRDMQHIVVLTSRPANLHAKDWKTNGVGRNVSHSFGYGLMDAESMVRVARQWVTVPQQKICSVRSPPVDKLIPAKSHIELSLEVSCEDEVNFLEHVQAKVTLTATRRGDLHIYLTSPVGTKVNLLAQRPMDNSRSGFQNWPFMSVHTWGENPNGLWKIEVHNEGRYIYSRAYLKEWTLVMYGTTENPDRRVDKSFPSLSPPSSEEANKPYYNDKLGNDLEKSFDDLNHNSAGKSMMTSDINGSSSVNGSSSSTRKPYPSPGKFSGRFPIKQSPSSSSSSLSNDKTVKKPNVQPIDNNDINLLSPINQNTQHNSVLGVIHGTREDKSSDESDSFILGGKSFNRGCILKDSGSQCLECSHNMVLINGVCLDNCPEGYYRSTIAIKIGSESLRCSRCHYSCKTCSGAADSNCTTCFPDATINTKGHCHSLSLVNQVITLERWYSTITIVFTICCLVILLLIVYIVVGRSNDLICCIVETKRNHHHHHSSSSSSSHHRHRNHHNPHSLNHSRFSYVDLPTNHNHHHIDNQRRRSTSQRLSINTNHQSREILNLSKKMLTDQTSEDDL
ncbi:furin-like protease kpc-1 isoform X2 [Panonychus citri]|uniref:furin-like protease kpc-1 isoform X2 n=1 Tax=Panonychus citri TaxID=50023 RepID=UPI00230713AA|nr:furin-like protease kpc-1 isoform X2 [Panonychus citri]